MDKSALILPGERLDDLLVNGLYIIQHPDVFRFGCDAVELADFVTAEVATTHAISVAAAE